MFREGSSGSKLRSLVWSATETAQQCGNLWKGLWMPGVCTAAASVGSQTCVWCWSSWTKSRGERPIGKLPSKPLPVDYCIWPEKNCREEWLFYFCFPKLQKFFFFFFAKQLELYIFQLSQTDITQSAISFVCYVCACKLHNCYIISSV